MRINVIIPTYNEAKKIGEVVAGVRRFGLDVLVIDDGSTDNTAESASLTGAVILRNKINMGKGASLKEGFDYSVRNNFDAVITMDGDGQHLSEDIPAFLKAAEDPDNDIVIGNRMLNTKNMPLVRILTNKFMSQLISGITGQIIQDTQCGFRLIKRAILEKIDLKTTKYETESEILIQASRLGFKIFSVPITTVYRGEKSRINPISDTFRFFRFIMKNMRSLSK